MPFYFRKECPLNSGYLRFYSLIVIAVGIIIFFVLNDKE
ncbi:putative membrane protein [Shigella boydii 5216-82]|nr:putative membrane protein [Shigella boydii 5216-82]